MLLLTDADNRHRCERKRGLPFAASLTSLIGIGSPFTIIPYILKVFAFAAPICRFCGPTRENARLFCQTESVNITPYSKRERYALR